MKFGKIPPIPLLFLPLTIKYCRLWRWRSVINFVDRFQEAGEDSWLCQGEGLIIMTSKRKCVRAWCWPFPYLKVLLIAWIHKTGKISYTFRATIMWSTCEKLLTWIKHVRKLSSLIFLLECATVFPIKNKVFAQHLVNRLFWLFVLI